MTVLEAFYLVATEPRNELEQRAQETTGAVQGVFKAVIAQYEGRVDAAVAILNRHLKTSRDIVTRAVLADVLAPIYIQRHELEKLEPLISALCRAGWTSAALSFQALKAAKEERRETSLRIIAKTLRIMSSGASDIMVARVQQRLALATFFLHQYERSSDLALSGAALSTKLRAWRPASACYSILYNISYSVTGDLIEADRFAQLCRRAALHVGDNSFYYSALVAEFELAVQFGDHARVAALDVEIKAKRLPQQYSERFPLVISHALTKGATDLIGMRTLLHVLRDTPDRSRGEWSLCVSLIALSHVAEYDDTQARDLLKKSIAYLGRASVRQPAYEQQSRRIARAMVAACYVILGDEALAQRILRVREMGPTFAKSLISSSINGLHL